MQLVPVQFTARSVSREHGEALDCSKASPSRHRTCCVRWPAALLQSCERGAKRAEAARAVGPTAARRTGGTHTVRLPLADSCCRLLGDSSHSLSVGRGGCEGQQGQGSEGDQEAHSGFVSGARH